MNLELCRGRAGESTSIEELAMHRALAVHVRDRFLGPGVVRSARAGMVNTAVEVSLNYNSLAHADKRKPKEKSKDKPKPKPQDTLKPFNSMTVNNAESKTKNSISDMVTSPQRDKDGKENKKPDKISPKIISRQKQLRVSHDD